MLLGGIYMANIIDKELERKEKLKIAKTTNGKTVKEIDKNNILGTSKRKNLGIIGSVYHAYFGLENDTSPEPDFPDIDLEIKTTGLKKNQKSKEYVAKERLSLTKVDFASIGTTSFEESRVRKKCAHILLGCYEYEGEKRRDRDYGNLKFINSFLINMSDLDLQQIKDDYEYIKNKIITGHADDLHESDTLYLGVATKGTPGKLTKEPISQKEVRPKAFVIKKSYISTVIQQELEKAKYEDLGNIMEGQYVPIKEYVLGRFENYYGWSQKDLMSEFKIKSKDSKQLFKLIVNSILNIKNFEKITEFHKANIIPKTIRITKGGKIKEKMSFPAMDFMEVAFEEFDDSDEKEYFQSAVFLFIIFQEKDDGEYYFDKSFFYSLKEDVVDKFLRYTYEQTREVLNSGKIVSKIKEINVKGKIKSIYCNNFIKPSCNRIFHVRPHGANFDDVSVLAVPDKLTGLKEYEKMCFWLDTEYILHIIHDKEKEYEEYALENLGKKSKKKIFY